MGIETALTVGGGLLGGLFGGSKQSGNATSTQQQKLDPRIDSMLFGSNGDNGILSQYQSYLNKPEDPSLSNYGQANLNYLGSNGASNLGSATGAANSLLGGNSAPTYNAAQFGTASTGRATTSIPAYAVGNMVQAPNQNGIDLTGSYNSLLSGGNTDALMKSLQAGNDVTNAGFNKNQTDLTNNLLRNVLPSLRGGAIAAGQYGGSRQGIAEGNALSDFTNQLNTANTQLSAANSANNANALAGAYENGQNRALSATQGLGAQQYGVASQDAATKNQAEFTNVQNAVNAANTNAGYDQQAMLSNAQLAQQAHLANQSAVNSASAANQASQLQTNGQNNSALLGGAGLLSGLSNQAYGVGQNQNNYGLTQAQAVNGLLAPYTGVNSTTTSNQPLYSNTAGNVLGGGLLGAQLGGLFGGKSSSGASMGSLADLFGKGSTFGSFSGNFGS